MPKVFIVLGGVIVLFVAIIFGLNALLSPNDLANCDERPGTNTECAAADVIVVVSGGDTPARVAKAIELYENGWANKIVFSGAAADPKSPSNATAMKRQAAAANVPESAIITENTSKNTHENALNVDGILDEINARTVILVTSPYHLRRTQLEFQKLAPDVNFRTAAADDKVWNYWWIKPNGWWLAFTEFGGIIKLWSGL